MKKLFSTEPYNPSVNIEEDYLGSYSELVHVFAFKDEDEAEDFQILSHNEQLAICGFKEEKTPSKGTVHRYIIDASDAFVVVRETIMSW